MSAAVAARQGGTAHNGNSNSNSRMGTGSPVDTKRNVKGEDKPSRPSSASSYNQRDSSKIGSPKQTSHAQSLASSNTSSSLHPPQVSINQPPDISNPAPNPSNPSNSPPNQHVKQAPRSLPPPPPPGHSQRDIPGDYFAINHHSRLDQEPNVFEESFANPGPTPNDPLATPKAILPPVTAITSPASLLPGGPLNWGINSLRSGPLSPAMLQGPTTSSGGVGASSSLGFESHIRTGLTPNESGIRSGLTPGGSGSMFAQPQNTMFQFATSGGGTTPGTLEFHKTAISAVRKGLPGMSTSQHISVKPEDTSSGHNDHDQKSRQHSDPYHGSDPAHNAASGLFLLAQAQHQQGDSAAAPMVTSGTGYQNNSQLPSVMSGSNGGPIESPSPSLAKRAVVNSANNAAMSSSINRSASSVTSMTNSIRASSEASDMSNSDEDMPMSSNNGSRNARGRKNKGASMNGRRKAEDQSPSGGTSRNKKAKVNQSISGGSDDGNDGMDLDDNQTGKDGKKMTDEEKRKNFLERNRVAALKCRQRKKQWLANLQAKVELYSSENDALTAQVTGLREEIMSLKTLLLAHKDCPVALANGLNINLEAVTSNMGNVNLPNDYSHAPMMGQNYRMAMGNGGNNGMGNNGMGGSMMGPPGSGRRYS